MYDQMGSLYTYCSPRFWEGGCERHFYDEDGNLIKKVEVEYYEAEEDDGRGYPNVFKSIGIDVNRTTFISNKFYFDNNGMVTASVTVKQVRIMEE